MKDTDTNTNTNTENNRADTLTIENIPLYINVTKNKRVALNMNIYRNLHYHTCNKAKQIFKAGLKDSLSGLGSLGGLKDSLGGLKPVSFKYTIFRASNRRADIMNIGSIVDKFTSDALVELGYLADDNTNIIKQVTIIDGGVDKENPHAKLEIKRILEGY